MARGSLLQGIQIAPELEREARAGQQIAIPQSDGMAEAASGLAREFGQIGQRIGQLADHAASVEGKREGHLAGLDPEFRPRRDGTIRGEAFDKAALDTYQNRTFVEIDKHIADAAMKHQADPRSLAKVLAGAEKGFLQNAPAELAPEITTRFAHGSMIAQREATRQLWARQAQDQEVALRTRLANDMAALHQGAYAAGLDPAAFSALGERVAAFDRAMGARGPDGKLLVSPEARVALATNMRQTVATGQLYGAFDRLPDAAAKERFIAGLDEQFRTSQGPVASLDLPHYERVKGHLEAELRKETSRAHRADATLKALVEKVQHRADKGDPIQKAELDALDGMFATATPELRQAYADAKDSHAFQESIKSLPLPQLEEVVAGHSAEIAANPPSLTRDRLIRRRDKAEALLKSAREAVTRDPLDWDRRVGMAEAQPLGTVMQITDKGIAYDQGAVGQWGARRIAEAEASAARHGLAAVPYLDPLEKRLLTKAFEQGGQRGLQAAVALREAFGPKAETVLKSLGRDAPAGAHVAALAMTTGSTPAVSDAAEGLHMMTRPDHKRLAPPEARAKLAADEVLGGSAPLGRAPGFLLSAMRTADAIYEARAARGRLAEFDDRMWKQAFREALGETTRADGFVYGGYADMSAGWSTRKVVLPPSVRQKDAAGIFLALRPEDLGVDFGDGPRGKNGMPLTRQELQGAHYVTVAPGQYLLAMRDPHGADPGWATGPDGRAYVLDLDKALVSIRRRRPDLRR